MAIKILLNENRRKFISVTSVLFRLRSLFFNNPRISYLPVNSAVSKFNKKFLFSTILLYSLQYWSTNMSTYETKY